MVYTYSVPATLVLICDTSEGRSFAKPKSEIFGVRSWSRSILLALMSRWTTWGRTPSWRYASPWATPMQIFTRVLQLNWMLLCWEPDKWQGPRRITASEIFLGTKEYRGSAMIIYLEGFVQGYYFQDNYRQGSCGFLPHNSHKAWQDSHGKYQRS